MTVKGIGGLLSVRRSGEAGRGVPRLKWRSLAALSIAVPLVLAAWSIGPAFANEPLIKLSTDPYVDPASQHMTEVEPDTFAFGTTVVSAFQVGRFFNGGASNAGFATSIDSGATWKHGFLPGTTKVATPPGTYDRASDTSVAYDAKHKTWLISFLGLITPDPTNESTFLVDVLVSRSTDGGLTWGNPIVVNPNPRGSFLDKNWTACDDTPSSPHYGNCYTEYDDVNRNDLEQMSTSSDGGLTWGAPQTTADAPNVFSIPAGTPGAHGLGGQPVVQPNGHVIVPYVDLDIEASGAGIFTISDFMSTDGGATWSATTLISESDFHQPNSSCPALAGCGVRADIPLPSAEIDRSGKVYVAWSDCRFEPSCGSSDIVLSNSTNGTAWSAVSRVPTFPISKAGDATPVDRFVPGLAVDRGTAGNSAHLGLAYYYYPNGNCTTATCELKLGFVSSTNGGQTWSANEQVAGPMLLNWLPNTTQGFMVGDYISTSIVRGAANAVPAFAVAHKPSGAVLDEAIYTTVNEALTIRGGTLAAEVGGLQARSAVSSTPATSSTGSGTPLRLASVHTAF
ncbi:MAG TPA: sialidase family protein [Chloroflexota bacterium]|nr:sialidase family protein [Chloroflexota bacterium]